LNLLREVAEAAANARRRCLSAISKRQYGEALAFAQAQVRLNPDEDTLRMLAVCCLLEGDFNGAKRVVQRSITFPKLFGSR
jgi:hypothetical protein